MLLEPVTELVEQLSDSSLIADESGWLGLDLAIQESKSQYDEKVLQMRELESALGHFGLSLLDVPGDGSCQFHACVLAGGLDVAAEDLRKEVIVHMAEMRISTWGSSMTNHGRSIWWP